MRVFIFCAALLFSVQGFAVDVKKEVGIGQYLLMTGEYDRARELFIKLADTEGFVEANYHLAVINMNGYGVERNLLEAESHYLIAAEQGHSKAQYELGVLYNHYLHQPIKALMWFDKAIQQGEQNAANDASTIYATQKKYDKALEVLLASEYKEHGPSLFTLSQFYLYGLSIEQDLTKGVNLLKRSIEFDYLPAVKFYADQLLSGNLIDKDEQHAEKYLQYAFSLGDLSSGHKLVERLVLRNDIETAQPIMVELVNKNYQPTKRLIKRMLEIKQAQTGAVNKEVESSQ